MVEWCIKKLFVAGYHQRGGKFIGSGDCPFPAYASSTRVVVNMMGGQDADADCRADASENRSQSSPAAPDARAY
jgi:hypothetical protein